MSTMNITFPCALIAMLSQSRVVLTWEVAGDTETYAGHVALSLLCFLNIHLSHSNSIIFKNIHLSCPNSIIFKNIHMLCSKVSLIFKAVWFYHKMWYPALTLSRLPPLTWVNSPNLLMPIILKLCFYIFLKWYWHSHNLDCVSSNNLLHSIIQIRELYCEHFDTPVASKVLRALANTYPWYTHTVIPRRIAIQERGVSTQAREK